MGPEPIRRRSRRAVTLLSSALTSLALLLGAAPVATAAATAAAPGETIDVYVTFEGHTLGQGYYVEPVKVSVPSGHTAAQVTAQVLGERGHVMAPDPGDPTSPSWYLSGVSGMDKGFTAVPTWITSQDGFALDPADGDAYLGTPDYNAMSGWMYTVDNVMAPVGAGAYVLEDGDVMRWQFTLHGYGCDMGVPSGCWGAAPYYEMVDRSELIRAVAAPDATTATDAEIASAKAVAIDPVATAAQISAALTALTTAEPWTVVETVSGQFSSRLQAALVAQHGQSAGATDASVVTRLRVDGTMNAADWSALRTAGTHVRDLDLSAMTSSSMQSLEGMAALTDVVLPPVRLLNTTNLFRGSTTLRRVTVQAATTTFGSSSTFTGVTGLERVTFLGATAPATVNAGVFNGSNNSDPDARTVVAVVPDRTSGGYQRQAFGQYFADVVDAGDNPAATTAERAALQASVTSARAATRISIVTDARWTALQDALTHGAAVLAAPGSTSGAVVDATTDLDAALVALHGLTVAVPRGAQVGLYRKGSAHFTPFTAYPLVKVPELSTDDVEVHGLAADLPNGTYNVQASVPGETDKVVKFFTVSAGDAPARIELTLTPDAERETTPLLIPGFGAGDSRNLYTNLDDTGVVELQVGETFALDTFRTAQGQSDQVTNYFIEPDFAFDVSGDAITTAPIGAEGRRQLEITATKPGTSVVAITYGALKYVNAAGKEFDFNPIEEQNTGLVVVRVADAEAASSAAFDTGIDARNDLDTFYFDRTRGSRPYTFTPAAGTTVRVHDPLNVSAWGTGWTTYAAADDGSFTVDLKGGRNIVELTREGVVQHRVLRAKGIEVEITNVSDAGAEFEPGDQARITLTGVESGIEKMAGIYNPGFGAGARPKITYRDGDQSLVSNEGGQYTSVTTPFAITYTYTGAETTLDGTISIGGMGAEWPYHREIPLTGKPANLNAVGMGPYAISAMPTIHVHDGQVTTKAKPAPVDRSVLSAEIERAAALTETDFTAASWAVLSAAKAAAEATVATQEAEQSEIDAALAELSAAIEALVARSVPRAPTAPTLTLSGDEATVTWSAPGDGGWPLTGYTVTLTRAGGEKRQVNVGAESTTARFEDLRAGEYTAHVVAENALGASAESAPSAAVTVAAPPVSDPQVGTRLTLDVARQVYGRTGTVAVVVAPTGTSNAPVNGVVRATFGTRTVTARVVAGRATLAIPATVWEPGRRAFTATFVPADSAALRGSRATAVARVVKASAAVKVTTPKKVRRGATATIRVTVTAPGAPVRGKVRVTLAGRTSTLTLTPNKANGRAKAVVKIRVPKKAAVGKRTVTVKYLGSARVGAATPQGKAPKVRILR